MAMELRHMRYFAAIAREGSFVSAARVLNIAQPALSRSIKELEEHLGVILLNRRSDGSRLTKAGEAFNEDVIRILEAVDAAAVRVRQQQSSGTIRVAHTLLFSGMHEVLDAALARFAHRNPQFGFAISVLSTFEQEEALQNDQLDVGFGHFESTLKNTLASFRLMSDPYCGARVGSDSPLASRSSLAFQDIRDIPLMLFPRRRNPILFDKLSREMKALGFRADILQHEDNSERHWRVLPTSPFWALCPSSEMNRTPSGSVSLPFTDLMLDFGLDAIYKRAHAEPHVRSFIQFLKSEGASTSPGAASPRPITLRP